MSITIQNITKKFGNFVALNNVSLEVSSGELVALLGPSGSGKTSLLRIIAGLEYPDSGCVFFQGEDSSRRRLGERRVGFVFQHYALFRNMTVFENIAFGLRVKPRKERLPEKQIRAKVAELLELVQMNWMADRYPSQLSGGQRQRIALARALAVEPQLLLLDEPFGALDAKVRKELRRWIRRLHDEIHLTSIFVTHDQEEALEVADRVVVMNEGRIEQVGTPEELYDQPSNLFVYKFLGDVNLFRGRSDLSGDLVMEDAAVGLTDDPLTWYARPHELRVSRAPIPDQSIAAVVNYTRAIGPIVKVELKGAEIPDYIEVNLTKEEYRELALRPGERVWISKRDI